MNLSKRVEHLERDGGTGAGFVWLEPDQSPEEVGALVADERRRRGLSASAPVYLIRWRPAT